MCTEPLDDLRSYQWFRIRYTEPFNVLLNYQWFRKMRAEPLQHLRNYWWLRTIYTEPFDDLRNYRRIPITNTKPFAFFYKATHSFISQLTVPFHCKMPTIVSQNSKTFRCFRVEGAVVPLIIKRIAVLRLNTHAIMYTLENFLFIRLATNISVLIVYLTWEYSSTQRYKKCSRAY
jgi:hypothetical protein